MLTKAGAETEAIAARATAGAVAAAGDDTTPADVFDAVVTDDVVAGVGTSLLSRKSCENFFSSEL